MEYTGQLVTGDFEENTITFEIEGEMILQAGKYTIARIENESELKNLCIADVVKSLPNDEEVKAHIDTLPYYGTCTTEYNEGFEDGVKWLKEQMAK